MDDDRFSAHIPVAALDLPAGHVFRQHLSANRPLGTYARIFISYAHRDGREIAAELRRRLEDTFSLWQDVDQMEGGKDWWRQVAHAIDHVEFLVLVMTPAAFASAVVRDEWRYARRRGVCVVPIQGDPEFAADRLPGWMRRTHVVDPSDPEQWTRFLRTLESPCETERVPHMADLPPVDFVPRPAELAALRSKLLDPTTGEAVAITAALDGAGGYGKTTLARAVCQDEAVVDAYHDGILWVTIGADPSDISEHVESLIVALAGKGSGVPTLEGRRHRLAELLADRTVLIIVDDVWNEAHLRPFLGLADRCTVLVTTRRSSTLPKGAATVRVDAMNPPQALRLIRHGLPRGEQAALLALVERLGEWPLLIKLVNGVIRQRVERANDTLQGAVAHAVRVLDRRGLTGFDARDPQEQDQAVAKTLALSLEQLDRSEQARFGELAVFPEDVDVPIEAIALLWGGVASLDELDTEELLQRLSDLSLLLDFDLARRTARLHDVIRAYLLGRIGDDVQRLDRVLVAAYRAEVPDGWSSDLADGYFIRHLPAHLHRAGLHDELRALLLDVDWIHAKLRQTGAGAVLVDYDRYAADATVAQLGWTLRLSSHALARNPDSLLSQLRGRIEEGAGELGGIVAARAKQPWSSAWLRPRFASLTRPGGALRQILTGHTEAVGAVAITPDGTRAVSASGDGTLRVWQLDTGQTRHTLAGHDGWVRAVAVTRDGTRAVSASDDGTLRVWDLQTGEERQTLEGHAGPVHALAVTSDGTRVVSGSDDGTVRVWDLDTGRTLHTLGHAGFVRAVAVSRDAARAVAASHDAKILVWDLDSGRVLHTLQGHGDFVQAVAVTRDFKYVVAASDGFSLRVWDLDTGQVLRTLEGHEGLVRAIALTPDDTRVVSASDDHTLRIWDVATGRALHVLEGHTGRVHAVAVTPDGSRAVSASGDSTLRSWDLHTGQTLCTLEAHSGWVRAVAIASDGLRAVSAAEDRTLRVWKLDAGPAAPTPERHTGRVHTVVATRDGMRAVSGAEDRTVRVWDLVTGHVLHTLEGHTDAVRAVAITADGRRAVSASYDGTARVWDLLTGHVQHTLAGHTGRILAVAVARDGTRAVSASDDGSLRVWNLADGRMVHALDGHHGRVLTVALTRAGTRAVSGSVDRTVRVWDLDTGRCLNTLEGHTGWVRSIALTGDDARVVSASDDRTLRIWDLATGAPLHTLAAHTGVVRSVSVTSDGRAVSASLDRTVRVWDVVSGEPLHTLEGHAGVVRVVAVARDGKRAASASVDQTLTIWDLETGRKVTEFHADAPLACAAFGNEREVVAGSVDGSVHVLELVEP